MRRTSLPSLVLWSLHFATVAALQRSSLRRPASLADSADTALPSAKVFFLFLADDGLPNEEIWLRFLRPATVGREYEAFVHCQNESLCHSGIKSQGIFKVIPTVKSEWCEDLVSPMNALLEAALNSSAGSAADQFAFVSDTTVPVKPFTEVQRRLVMNGASGSSFCIVPQRFWAAVDMNVSGLELVVKHHQWVTLSRGHAEKVVSVKRGMRDLMLWTRPAYWWGTTWMSQFYQATLGKVAPLHPDGCLDEFLYFSLIYGFVDANSTATESMSNLEGLNGSPLHVSDNRSDDFQGQCDTYAFFGHRYGKKFNHLSRLLEADASTLMELHGIVQNLHPAQFNTLSPTSLKLLRDSEFLFARKVDARITALVKPEKANINDLPDAFEHIVFQVEQNE